MTSLLRALPFAASTALIVALGCSTTSSTIPTPEPAATEAPPVAKSNEPGATLQPVASAEFEPVYFDLDSAVLTTESRSTLKDYARSILAHPTWGVIRIDGHCDERGSDAYNLTLGTARANAVEHYLVQLGVPASRLTTRSFGARKPAVRGSDESAWRFNRRSELRPADGLASL